MRLNDVDFGEQKPVEGYGTGFFNIGGTRWEGPILLLQTGVQAWGGPQDISPLVAALPDIDVLLFGTGKEIAHAPKELKHAIEEAGGALEVMASPAACRTYNVLIAEGRRVGAALLPVLD